MSIQRVQPGGEFRPEARAWNAFASAAEWVRARQTGAERGDGFTLGGRVKVANASLLDAPLGGLLKLAEASAISPAEVKQIAQPDALESPVLFAAAEPLASGDIGDAWPLGSMPRRILASDYATWNPYDRASHVDGEWYAEYDEIGSLLILGECGDQPATLPAGTVMVWAVSADAWATIRGILIRLDDLEGETPGPGEPGDPGESPPGLWDEYFDGVRPYHKARWWEVVSNVVCGEAGAVSATFTPMLAFDEYDVGHWTNTVEGDCSCPEGNDREVHDLAVVTDARCNPNELVAYLQHRIETVKFWAYGAEYEEPLFETEAVDSGSALSDTTAGTAFGTETTAVVRFRVHSGCVWVVKRPVWVQAVGDGVSIRLMTCECCEPEVCQYCEHEGEDTTPLYVTVQLSGFTGDHAKYNGTYEVYQSGIPGACAYQTVYDDLEISFGKGSLTTAVLYVNKLNPDPFDPAGDLAEADFSVSDATGDCTAQMNMTRTRVAGEWDDDNQEPEAVVN